jgi:hypothetical protein
MERPITAATRVSTRVPHWEQVLAVALRAAQTKPFVWGQHDCATWAFDLYRDLTDGPDHAALWRGRYRTRVGCGRVLRRLGWTSLEEGGRALLGDPLDDVRLAQRGDLILGSEPEAFGVVIGAKAAFVAPAGLVRLSLATCRLAWRT